MYVFVCVCVCVCVCVSVCLCVCVRACVCMCDRWGLFGLVWTWPRVSRFFKNSYLMCMLIPGKVIFGGVHASETTFKVKLDS